MSFVLPFGFPLKAVFLSVFYASPHIIVFVRLTAAHSATRFSPMLGNRSARLGVISACARRHARSNASGHSHDPGSEIAKCRDTCRHRRNFERVTSNEMVEGLRRQFEDAWRRVQFYSCGRSLLMLAIRANDVVRCAARSNESRGCCGGAQSCVPSLP